MPTTFEVTMKTQDYAVDMKSGLETLQGISDATRCIAETVVTGRVPQKQSAKGSVRTSLKKTFKGSYGQTFSLEILDENLMREYRKVGRITFSELMAYFMSESLYLDSKDLSPKAKKILEKMGSTADKLIKQLRISSMKKAHSVPINFGHDVKIDIKENAYKRITIAEFDENTVKSLQATVSKDSVMINASITRLNINTGNGRLRVENEDETVAFGFTAFYKKTSVKIKRKLSDNLSFNNITADDEWRSITINANPVKLLDGKVIKYLITGIKDD